MVPERRGRDRGGGGADAGLQGHRASSCDATGSTTVGEDDGETSPDTATHVDAAKEHRSVATTNGGNSSDDVRHARVSGNATSPTASDASSVFAAAALQIVDGRASGRTWSAKARENTALEGLGLKRLQTQMVRVHAAAEDLLPEWMASRQSHGRRQAARLAARARARAHWRALRTRLFAVSTLLGSAHQASTLLAKGEPRRRWSERSFVVAVRRVVTSKRAEFIWDTCVASKLAY